MVDHETDAFRQLRATHDPAAHSQRREHLILAYRALVKSVTRRYHAQGFARGWTVEDIEQEGIIGLMNAIDRYDPDGLHRGIRFRTVADFAIRLQLRKALQIDISEQPTMPLPLGAMNPHVNPMITPVWLQDRITQELEALPSHEPSVEEQVVAAVDGAQLSATLEAALLLLPERQRVIIERRYGLLGDQQCWTCEEVGRLLGIHKSNVCRAQQKALGTLRRHLGATQDGALILMRLDEKRSRRAKTRAAA
jgi:RNA polymerase sigma factor (sigma-70 family)